MRVLNLIGLLLSGCIMPALINAADVHRQFHFFERTHSSCSDQEPMFSSLIRMEANQTDLFTWSPGAKSVLLDYEQSVEERALQAINDGEWTRVIGGFRGTKTAKTAIENLHRAGFDIRHDGSIVPQTQNRIFVFTVPFTR